DKERAASERGSYFQLLISREFSDAQQLREIRAGNQHTAHETSTDKTRSGLAVADPKPERRELRGEIAAVYAGQRFSASHRIGERTSAFGIIDDANPESLRG